MEPNFDPAYFHNGFWRNNVIAMHLFGRYIGGYNGKVPPPYSRYYMGGENDVRGFDIWSISPAAYIPTTQTVPVYNNDGTARVQQIIQNGVPTTTPVQMQIPAYHDDFPRRRYLGCFEPRIPDSDFRAGDSDAILRRRHQPDHTG